MTGSGRGWNVRVMPSLPCTVRGSSESGDSDRISRSTVFWEAPTTGAMARDDMPLNAEKRPRPDREDQAGALVSNLDSQATARRVAARRFSETCCSAASIASLR